MTIHNRMRSPSAGEGAVPVSKTGHASSGRPAPVSGQPCGEAATLRLLIEETIERLLDVLDCIDGDSDFEPWLTGAGLQGGDDREGGDADLEVSLGATDDFDQRAAWSTPFLIFEDDFDREFDPAEFEPREVPA